MKILICSDGSEQADRAIRLGAAIAAGAGAEVTLFGIIEAPDKLNLILDSLKRWQAVLADKKINTELITKPGDPIAEIVERTEADKYDLVIVGAVLKETRGLFWMSSKSYKIIKEVTPPVLSVAGESATIKRALICSGGKYSDSAVRLTAKLAGAFGASVTLLHVMPEPPAFYAGLPRMAETADWVLHSSSELGLTLRSERDFLVAAGLTAEVRLRQGPVLSEILREIRSGNYDLVVTGSAPSRSLRTYVLGDISREIVNRSNCAVLLVRSQEKLSKPGPRFRHWWGRGEVNPRAEGRGTK
jgi:nucleotide-binding universal stress UspA family protein